jgi:hypothetical protein
MNEGVLILNANNIIAYYHGRVVARLSASHDNVRILQRFGALPFMVYRQPIQGTSYGT